MAGEERKYRVILKSGKEVVHLKGVNDIHLTENYIQLKGPNGLAAVIPREELCALVSLEYEDDEPGAAEPTVPR